MNLKLNIDLKMLLKIAQKAQVYVFGLALVAAFAYTAYVVNIAINVKANETTTDPTLSKPIKIVFDKKVIEGLKKLSSVSGEVPTGNLGTSDPFR